MMPFPDTLPVPHPHHQGVNMKTAPQARRQTEQKKAATLRNLPASVYNTHTQQRHEPWRTMMLPVTGTVDEPGRG